MLFQDLVHAARALRKSASFTAIAVVTISLGVGVSSAMFSVCNAVLLRPLPYEEPDRLVFAFGEFRKRGVTDWPFSNANFVDLRSGARAMFEDCGGVFTSRAVHRFHPVRRRVLHRLAVRLTLRVKDLASFDLVHPIHYPALRGHDRISTAGFRVMGCR